MLFSHTHKHPNTLQWSNSRHTVPCSQMHLPDMELVVNLGDWPLNKADRMPLFPVFSWCGSPDTRDIIWPTWDIMKSTVMGLDRYSLSYTHKP